MSQADADSFHNGFCANRSVGTAAIFISFCAMMVIAAWREVSGKPHPPDTGAFLLSYQAIALLVGVLLFVEFKCLRERTVIGLSFVTPAIALSFAAVPTLAGFRPLACWTEFAVWTTALAISLSMLASALRNRNRRSSS